jgi:outer membrane protein assembly factor BamD
MKLQKRIVYVAAACALVLGSSGCFRKHKYDNRINKDTQQPDKVLFDAAIDDIQHSRFQRARLTLQTLMNTYDTSEYMAKAKLAIADSWFREGGSLGFAQAEAEYKDFILFYPNMEESAEAQVKVCKMQYQQMEKADRDQQHALRAEGECRQLLTQFPNSKFAPEAQLMMLKIQEVLAEGEFKVGSYYNTRGTNYSAANRLQALTEQYPLYSKADDALWMLGLSYRRMGDRFEEKEAAAYTRIVRDYPLSDHVEQAKAMLDMMKRPIPEADPVAAARMKYELENHTSRSLLGKAWGPFSGHPDTSAAAKSGTPQMTGFRPTIPVSVPPSATGIRTTGEVTAEVPADPNAIDKNPDARKSVTGGSDAAAPATSDAKTDQPAQTTAASATPASTTNTPAANNNNKSKKPPKLPKLPKKKKVTDKAVTAQPAADSAAPAAGTVPPEKK